jgi:hypothetical protein
VFFDIDSIELGQDFRTVIASTLESCDVVLVLIGPTWLAEDEHGRRRIDDPTDFHRIEVETALNSGLRVIPVLVGGAPMPSSSELPTGLQGLAFRNALTVDHNSFNRDVQVLERALRRIEPERPIAAASPSSAATRDVPPADVLAAPAPSQSASVARGRRVAVIAVVAAVALLGIVIATRGGGSTTTDATSLDPGAVDSVVLPAADDIVQQPVDVAVDRLTAAGLGTRVAESGCSNSTDPGFVRQVTVGTELNAHVLFGKSTDEIDSAAAGSLQPGDEVTVWTPTSNPC